MNASSPTDAPVMILAGGTGGHIFPGIAVADALRARGVPVVWLGSRHGLETRLVPAAGIVLDTIAVQSLRGRSALSLLTAPLQLTRAVWQALRVVRRRRPRSVLSLGGFAAGPGGMAAWLLRRPLLVHEQNRVPGVTNRVLARIARRVLCGFPDAFPSSLATITVGNPVRPAIAALPSPADRMTPRSGPIRLLVLGGSQGARALNLGVPLALAQLDGHAIDVRHQCGERHRDQALQAYADAGVPASVESFIDDMAQAYAWADLAICRAGALTLAEIAAAGVGALLVPLPHAADDHQTRNAEFLVAGGAARLIREGDGLVPQLRDALRELLPARAQMLSMANAARAMARPDAAERVADHCLAEASQ
jgi:UDP-N-acetylglucosamine--N-acetylmuramyl-(pentapeptide) pyrophosphoryl-undecaprenol N-acetylglucosamine transferase